MKIAIMGAGGVGGYYGAVLARQGHEVTLVARGAHLRAVQAKGLRIRSTTGDFVIKSVRAREKAADAGVVELLLMCTKAYDTPAAAEASRPMVGPETIVVGLQNGLEAHTVIGAILGMEHMLAGATGILVSIEAPGVIRMESISPWITVGEVDGHLSPRVQAVVDAFGGTGVEVEASDHILTDLWWKLMIMAPLAGMGALTRLPVGEYRSVEEARRLIAALKQEISALAAADGADLEADAVEKTLAGMDALPPSSKSSMQRDVESGRRSELEAVIGVICRKGRELGVPTPVADLFYALLLPVDLKAQEQ